MECFVQIIPRNRDESQFLQENLVLELCYSVFLRGENIVGRK